jgi:hypothetical protein
MEALERSLGNASGVFGYTGYAAVEELEEGIWDPRDAGTPRGATLGRR